MSISSTGKSYHFQTASYRSFASTVQSNVICIVNVYFAICFSPSCSSRQRVVSPVGLLLLVVQSHNLCLEVAGLPRRRGEGDDVTVAHRPDLLFGQQPLLHQTLAELRQPVLVRCELLVASPVLSDVGVQSLLACEA